MILFSRALRPAVMIFSVGLFLYLSGIGLKNIFRYNTFKLEYAQLLEKVEEERHRNITYKSDLSRLKMHAFWEEQAKVKLGFTKKGEVVYQFLPAQKWSNYDR